MTHYICIGSCHGISETLGTCQAENCEMHNKPLVECECEDGKHSELLEVDKLEDEIERAGGE